MMKVRMIEQRDNGVCLFELKNDEIKVITSNLGCHVLSVFSKDREGIYGVVVLGFENETLGKLILDLRKWKIAGMEMEVTWERSPDVLQIVSEMQSLN